MHGHALLVGVRGGTHSPWPLTPAHLQVLQGLCGAHGVHQGQEGSPNAPTPPIAVAAVQVDVLPRHHVGKEVLHLGGEGGRGGGGWEGL